MPIMIQLIGKSGSGKTCAVSDFPGPIHFYDLAGRIEPALQMRSERKDLTFEEYNLHDYVAFIKSLEAQQKPNNPVNTIVVDGYTECSAMILDYAISLRGESQRGGRKLGIVSLNTIEDFKVETRCLQNMCAILRELKKEYKKNVVLLTHIYEWTESDSEGKIVANHEETLAGHRKASEIVPTFFNDIWKLSKKPSPTGTKDKYIIQTRGGIARTIYPTLPDEIEWTGGDLWSKLKEHIKL